MPLNDSAPSSARSRLDSAVSRAGFYPEIVAEVIEDGLDGHEVIEWMIHQETHIDRAEVHRHLTALILSRSFLQIVHIDDKDVDEADQRPIAQLTSEVIALSRVSRVVVGYAHGAPELYRRTESIPEISVTIAWSGGMSVDMQPVLCADAQCERDHGYSGTLESADLMLRVNEFADGPEALRQARSFVNALRRACRSQEGSEYSRGPRS